MMNHESKRPVTVEDLVRLKRAERPAPEFWECFERELRAKQLAAIVSKRPWWGTVPRLLGGLKRYQIPLGATAILAVTFISVRQYQASASMPHQSSPIPAEEVAVASESPAVSAISEIRESRAADARTATPVLVAAVNEAPASAAPVALSSEATASGRLAEIVPWLGRAGDSESAGSATPVVQSLLAANLETVKATHPELARRFLGNATGFEITSASDHKVVDPFTRMRGPADLKRERLLAKALPAATNTTWNNNDRVVHKLSLSEDRLTEEAISRIGGMGDRLSLKF